MTAPRPSTSSTAPSTSRTCARRRCWSKPTVRRSEHAALRDTAARSELRDAHVCVFIPCCAGIHYRKSCASSGACLIASSGYQQFCTGRLNSVCIYCCNTPLCNGPRRKRPAQSAGTSGLRTKWPLLLLPSFLLPLLT